MPKVRLLDKHTAELIAAGEVVERPASVIKELVENSIDAGATSITVEIKRGGVEMLRITDNGCGISSEDVATAFLRHATSKIETGADLEAIATLGFRGEALASIAAVCRVELITRAHDSDVGLRYCIEGGEEILSEETACAVGTRITASDIFFNTPARMKFLKKDVAEGNACASAVDRIALSHPEIAFTFIRDGKECLRTPGDGKPLSAIRAVFGKEFASGLIPVKYALNNVSVEGYVTKPVNARPNMSMQVFFINGRYVKSRTMQAAVEEACKGAVMIGKHPACVLSVNISCAAVDVNVHPAKLEVRFTNERPVFDCVYWGVKNSLSENDERKEMKIPEKRPVSTKPPLPAETVNTVQTTIFKQEQPVKAPQTVQKPSAQEKPLIIETQPENMLNRLSGGRGVSDNAVQVIRPAAVPTPPRIPTIDIFPEKTKEEEIIITKKEPEQLPIIEPEVIEEPETEQNNFAMPDYRIIGEAFNTYIIVESEKQLIYIDKHAAHERLKYKKLMESRKDPASQLLSIPVTVTLEKMHYNAVLENLDLLAEAGFEVDDFGIGTVMVRAVPVYLVGTDIAGAVMEIAGNFGNKTDATVTAKTERMFQTIACKSAIKAGDDTNADELAQLVLELIANPDVRYCPHGRPIWISLKKSEIEKNFGRA